MFNKFVERAARPSYLHSESDIAFFIVSGPSGYYLDKDLDVMDTFIFNAAEFDQWINGNDMWELTTFCCDPDLMVAEGL